MKFWTDFKTVFNFSLRQYSKHIYRSLSKDFYVTKSGICILESDFLQCQIFEYLLQWTYFIWVFFTVLFLIFFFSRERSWHKPDLCFYDMNSYFKWCSDICVYGMCYITICRLRIDGTMVPHNIFSPWPGREWKRSTLLLLSVLIAWHFLRRLLNSGRDSFCNVNPFRLKTAQNRALKTGSNFILFY